MENKNECPKECIDLFENQNYVKIDNSHNTKLIHSEMKIKNTNEDIDKQASFDNILDTCETENGNTKKNLQDNHVNSEYLEKCSNDPLISLDKIKTDIAENANESTNGVINTQSKSKYINKFLKEDHHIPLKIQDNLLVYQNNDKIEDKYNVKLLHTEIKIENINEDIGEPLREDFDIILETCGSENSNSKKGVQENCDNSTYLKKCSNIPLIKLDGIQIDIAENDIELKNNEINTECKIKFVEVFLKEDHIIPLKVEDNPFEYQNNIKSEESFDNVLDTYESGNCNMQKSLLKNHNLSNVEKCSDSLINLDEIKIDIVENDFELANGEINTKCKNEYFEENPYKDHPNLLEIQDKDISDIDDRILPKTVEDEQKITTPIKISKFEVCSICNRQVKNITTHMTIHNGMKLLECNVCEKKYTRLSNLTQHMLIHTGSKPYECGTCMKKFTQKGTLTNHMLTHTGEKPHKCCFCEKKFTCAANLNRHKFIHTGNRKRHECSTCKIKFTQKSNLTVHMRLHNGEKPYECSVCKKKYGRLANLTYHMINHTGRKPFECDICQKKFAQKCNLSVHMRIHTGEKPHECNICEIKFTYIASFNRHMLIHTGNTAYECSICKMIFTQKRNLTAHMSTHSGENDT